MANNFEAILVVLTGITGLMFAFSLLFKRKRNTWAIGKLTKRPTQDDFKKPINIVSVAEYSGSFSQYSSYFNNSILLLSLLEYPGSMIQHWRLVISLQLISLRMASPINSYKIIETKK